MIWKIIPGYELYEVSEYGDVRRKATGRVKKPYINKKNGYLRTTLCINSKIKNMNIHVLVAMSFHGHKPTRGLEVNHKDRNKLNNHYTNIEVLTTRRHSEKTWDGIGTSKHRGVIKLKRSGKYQATIKFNGVKHYLGRFKTEEEAAEAYNNKLKELEHGC